MNVLYIVGLGLFLLTSVVLSIVILVQKTGLTAGLFSNSGAIGTGAKPQAITWTTSLLFGVFMVLAVILNMALR